MTPEKIAALRVLVVGDAMADVYIPAVQKETQEGGLACAAIGEAKVYPGGAANAAAIARALGCKVTLVTSIGEDDAGFQLQQELGGRGVRVFAVGYETTTKTRYVLESGKTLARVDRDAVTTGEAKTYAYLRLLSLQTEGPWDVVILSDYAKGLFDSPELIQKAKLLAKRSLVLDPKRAFAKFGPLGPGSIITPNVDELHRYRTEVADATATGLASKHMANALAATAVFKTLGREGVDVWQAPGHVGMFKPPTAFDLPAVGAGDAFAVGAGIGKALTDDLPTVARFAVRLASTYVRQGRDVLPSTDQAARMFERAQGE